MVRIAVKRDVGLLCFSCPAGVGELRECLSTLSGPAYEQRNHVVLVNRLDYDYKLSSATKPQNYSPEF